MMTSEREVVIRERVHRLLALFDRESVLYLLAEIDRLRGEVERLTQTNAGLSEEAFYAAEVWPLRERIKELESQLSGAGDAEPSVCSGDTAASRVAAPGDEPAAPEALRQHEERGT